MKRSLLEKTLFVLGLLIGGFACGCTSEDPLHETSAYDANPFWVYETPPPKHPRKRAHLDFFDKICDGKKGENYDCHYTDE